jgi:hypothetical protein
MLGDANDIVCPAGTQTMAGNLWLSEKSIKKYFWERSFGNDDCTRCNYDRAGFLYCISCHFIAPGMHMTINEQGVTREC